MNVFNLISAGGGAGSGLYIWKKSSIAKVEAVTNIVEGEVVIAGFTDASIPVYFGTGYTYNSTTGEYTLTGVTNHGTITKTSGSSVYFSGTYWHMIGSTTSKNMYRSTKTSYRGYFYYSGGDIRITGEYPSIAPVKKAYSENGYTFVDYAISDDENAYPSAGTQGGYYYEKAIELNPADLGASTFVSGEFTPTSNCSQYSIDHNQGKILKRAFVRAVTPNKQGGLLRSYQIHNGVYYGVGEIVDATTDTSNTATGTLSAPTENRTVLISVSSQLFMAGVKYEYLIFG